jgi:two-component system sensor histidine kinase UhpB
LPVCCFTRHPVFVAIFPELAGRRCIGPTDAKEETMPLRMRLIVLVALVLLMSLAAGSVLVGWRAANSVRTELRAALDVGARTVRNGYDDLGGTRDGEGELRHLIATFNGNRHVRAALVDPRGEPIAVSRPLVPMEPAPGWFLYLMRRPPQPVLLPVPQSVGGHGVIILQADPANEVGEVWAQSRDAVLVLAGSAALSALLISIVVGRALRSLESVSAAIEHVGEGDFHHVLPVTGPPELTRLASGFNLMTRRLAASAAQNRRLNERLLTLQAEERADLARDLHDEIGPLLFAVDMTAATMERPAGDGRNADIPLHARAIRDAVGHMQRHVRAILERLRPLPTVGLAAAINRLAAFWQARRPEIDFIVSVRVDQDRIADDVTETIYRVIQEGLSNAIRHGRPSRVEVIIEPDNDADGVRVVVADDGLGRPSDVTLQRGPMRFGLVGMRERVMAMAGSLSILSGPDGTGLRLVVRLPLGDVAQSNDQEATQ